MDNKLIYRALLIGYHFSLMRALPKLLNRSGFEVDVITTDTRCSGLKPVRQVFYAANSEILLSKATELSLTQFDLVVIGDDEVLLDLVRSDLTYETKLKLLPVCAVENFSHLGTKIGLSNLLKKAGILTPKFMVAYDVDQLVSLLRQTPYSVMLKNDVSAGGAGVFSYLPGDDVQAVLKQPLVFPLLIQQRIDGDVIDMSAFYQRGKLVHFGYAVMNSFANNEFGPSVVRTYSQLSAVPISVFEQLRVLGKVLGANGFVNITCLRDKNDNKHFIIEADMRPNVWVDYARYIGHDPAHAIHKYFDSGIILSNLQAYRVGYPQTLKIPHVYRLTALEILTNYQQVWRFCRDLGTADMLIRVVQLFMSQYVKPVIGDTAWKWFKCACSFTRIR